MICSIFSMHMTLSSMFSSLLIQILQFDALPASGWAWGMDESWLHLSPDKTEMMMVGWGKQPENIAKITSAPQTEVVCLLFVTHVGNFKYPINIILCFSKSQDIFSFPFASNWEIRIFSFECGSHHCLCLYHFKIRQLQCTQIGAKGLST